MPQLEINAPDGKVLSIDVPEGTPEAQYDSIVDDVIRDYQSNAAPADGPGAVKSAALGVMSGIPGAQTAVSALGAIGEPTYEESHQKLEELKDKAWENHPVAYGGGKTAGIVGTALAAPASLPAMGAIGALSGVDAAANLSDMPMEAAKGAGVGLVLGKAGQVVGEKVLDPLVNKLLPKTGKNVVAKLASDLTPEKVEEYLRRSGAINAAMTPAEIAAKVADLTGDVTKASGQLSQGARGMLSAEKAPIGLPAEIPTNPMLGVSQPTGAGDDSIKPIFDNLISRFTQSGVAPTAEKEAAVKVLQSEMDKLTRIAQAEGGKISEQSLREFIDALQDTVSKKAWGDPSVMESQNALKQLSGELRKILETSNPEYGVAMKPSAEAAGLSSDLQDAFKLEAGKPTDATVTKLGNVLKEGKTEGAEILSRLKDMTGQDIIQAMKDSELKGALATGGAGAALKTLLSSLFFGAGKMTGVPFGGIGGAAFGRFSAETMDGANLAKKILDAYLDKSRAWNNSAIKALVDKYGPVLVNAAKVGGNQLAATHFVLATSDPEYQQLTGQLQDERQ